MDVNGSTLTCAVQFYGTLPVSGLLLIFHSLLSTSFTENTENHYYDYSYRNTSTSS